MTKNPEALARQQKRTQMRREQVLAAAEQCFQREGFHAASVNRIAAEAGMSVGHVYRHFDNKEDIILTLCERKFADYISHTSRLAVHTKMDTDAVVNTALDDFDWLVDPVQARYVMDVFAESGRSEQINSIVADQDYRLRHNARVLLEPYFPPERPEELECRVEMLVLVLEGLMMRTVANPEGDKARLKLAFRHLMRAILQ